MRIASLKTLKEWLEFGYRLRSPEEKPYAKMSTGEDIYQKRQMVLIRPLP